MSTGDGVVGQWGGTDVHFGEDGGRLTYGSYLRLPQLLGLPPCSLDFKPGRHRLLMLQEATVRARLR